MAFVGSTPQEQRGSALVAILLTAGLGWMLAIGLGYVAPPSRDRSLQLFEITPPPEPERRPRVTREAPRRDDRRAGEAAPPNLRSEPTQVVAPEPAVEIEVPPIVTVAPIAGLDAATTAGSAEVPGPGTGAGGAGDGRGSGGAGDGDGGGWGGESAPVRIAGGMRDADFPEALIDAGIGGTVAVRYTVWTDGRVRDCRIDASSGNAELDAHTCRLITRRFRFRPSRDARGRPVPVTIVENHSWIVRQVPAEREPRRRR